jgi:hypothetical protein
MDWAGYQTRVQAAQQTGDQRLVDLVADRTLRAMVRGESPRPARSFRNESIDVDRWQSRRVQLDTARIAASIPGPEEELVRREEDTAFWTRIDGLITARVRRDAKDFVQQVARLIVAGWTQQDIARATGRTQSSVSGAVGTLRLLLA